MLKAVIFDMDGVLINSQPLHFDADRLTLEELGVKTTNEEMEKYAGTAAIPRFKRFADDFNIDKEPAEIARRREEIMAEIFDNEDIPAVEGVEELLKDIIKNGAKTIVASSSPYAFIYKVLDKIKLRSYFNDVLSGEDFERSKPAPDVFLAAAKKLGAEPHECVVIEDSQNGVAAAVAAKIKVLGYINPTSGKQDISAADVVIDDFRKVNFEFLKNI